MLGRIEQQVWDRAGRACEYCRLPHLASRFTFAIDHIVARHHGGDDDPGNLALACLFCNSKKGPDIAGLDPTDRQLTRLYHPRPDRWNDHFTWSDHEIVGMTAVGRTTIVVLWMNDPRQVALRRLAAAAGLLAIGG